MKTQITQIFGTQITQIGCIALAMAMVFSVVSVAAEEGTGKMTVRNAQITGEVSGIGAGYISIIYARDEDKTTEYEMLLPIEKDVEFIRKSLSELVVGDIVSVKCDDYIKIDEEGKELCARRVAKEVKFLRPASEDRLVGKER
jgi:hypothetical protein